MCGIGAVFNLNHNKVKNIYNILYKINDIQKHRGPDSNGIYVNEEEYVGLSHTRLSIIDINSGNQPIIDQYGNSIVLNGEIYNYKELKNNIKIPYRTNSDTEVILEYYKIYGIDCIKYFKGIFSFVIWDNINKKFICVRDRFGVKPLYYTIIDDNIYLTSETKSLLNIIKPSIDYQAFKEYLVFQTPLRGKTLFKDIKEMLPGHLIIIENGNIKNIKYWDIDYNPDFYHSKKYFTEELYNMLTDVVKLNTTSDVEIGCYLSGGLDSSIISILTNKNINNLKVFNGKFDGGNLFDETKYVKDVVNMYNMDLYQKTITPQDFIENIHNVIYHLDYPVAGPGSFNQYIMSKYVSEHLKVIIGGQGGDEIFGGYVRYLLAYFEQCILGAIDDNMNNGQFIVTYESIIPNLKNLYNYKPMIKEFWSNGLFENKEKRYFQLIDRSKNLKSIITPSLLNDSDVYDIYVDIFHHDKMSSSYLDSMTRFDFKVILPSLLHVEDRMSMAHGIESRVPYLDQDIVNFVINTPSNIKFENGDMKHLLKNTFKNELPKSIYNRNDKMGFPIPLNNWTKNELREFVGDIFNSTESKKRFYLNEELNVDNILNDNIYSRNFWVLLSLELWQQIFFDNIK